MHVPKPFRISEGLPSCCHPSLVAVPSLPPRHLDQTSQSVSFDPAAFAQPLELDAWTLVFIEAIVVRSLSLRPGRLACRPLDDVTRGLQTLDYSANLPLGSQGFDFYPAQILLSNEMDAPSLGAQRLKTT
jgi:hypothetical protein